MTSCAGAKARTSSPAAPARTSSARTERRAAAENAAADEEQDDQEAEQRERRIESECRLDSVGEGRDRRGEDGGCQPEPDRAARDLKHVDDAPGQAGLRFVDRGDSGGGGGRVEAAHPEAEDDHPDDQGVVARVDVDLEKRNGAIAMQ